MRKQNCYNLLLLALVAMFSLTLAACATTGAQSSQSEPPFKEPDEQPTESESIAPPLDTTTTTPTVVASPPTATPKPSDTAPVPTDIVTDTAEVERTEILMLESMPVQIHLVAHGYFPDGCTTLHEVRQQRDGNTFTVTMTTQRPDGAMCTAVIVPFEETIPLDVRGLPAGTYMVMTNGITDTFTLDMDNTMP